MIEEDDDSNEDGAEDDSMQEDQKLEEMKMNIEEILIQEEEDNHEDQRLLQDWEDLQNDVEYLNKSLSSSQGADGDQNRETPHSERKAQRSGKKDPFLTYGSGIMSFFHLQ